MVKALEGNLYEYWLRALGLFSQEGSEERPPWGLQLLLGGKRRGRH